MKDKFKIVDVEWSGCIKPELWTIFVWKKGTSDEPYYKCYMYDDDIDDPFTGIGTTKEDAISEAHDWRDWYYSEDY